MTVFTKAEFIIIQCQMHLNKTRDVEITISREVGWDHSIERGLWNQDP
jgi:hypothetical protein